MFFQCFLFLKMLKGVSTIRYQKIKIFITKIKVLLMK